MAILQLIDQLADCLSRGWRIPFSNLSVIDANEAAHLLDRMRINVPSAIMESERTLSDRDLILQDARTEAERILHQARQRAAELLSDQAIVMAAQQEANRLVEEGRMTAQLRADEADQYAMQVLEDLSQKLQSIAKQVDNGVQVMKANRQAEAARPPTTDNAATLVRS